MDQVTGMQQGDKEGWETLWERGGVLEMQEDWGGGVWENRLVSAGGNERVCGRELEV